MKQIIASVFSDCIVLINTYRLIKNKVCHAQFTAHKRQKPVRPTIFMLDKQI